MQLRRKWTKPTHPPFEWNSRPFLTISHCTSIMIHPYIVGWVECLMTVREMVVIRGLGNLRGCGRRISSECKPLYFNSIYYIMFFFILLNWHTHGKRSDCRSSFSPSYWSTSPTQQGGFPWCACVKKMLGPPPPNSGYIINNVSTQPLNYMYISTSILCFKYASRCYKPRTPYIKIFM